MEAHLVAEISVSAVRHNLRLLRRHVGPDVRICPAVKADCYGHGLEILWPVIAEESDAMAVATAGEAMQLRRLGYTGEILMFFTPFSLPQTAGWGDTLRELIGAGITLTVVTPAGAQAVAGAAGELGVRARVHVKIDTGMGRSGVLYDAAPGLVDCVRGFGSLELAGLYTHFATADESDKSSALRQLERFHDAVDACGGGEGLTIHAANSAGAIDLPESHLDMIRPGIAVYGYQPSEQMRTVLDLRPCLRLKSLLMQIKDLSAGASVGYGLTHTFDRDSRVGLVPIGYADGYPRVLSGRTSVRTGTADIPVCGRIAMDQIIVDLSDADSPQIGDEVEVISPDRSSGRSVESLAALAGTIPYEITCGLRGRIRRVGVE